MASVPDDDKNANEFFNAEREKFIIIARQAWAIGNRIGQREADPRRVIASWLFIRTCVTAQSIIQLYEPPPSDYGDIKYLDHASIAALARSLIESAMVLLYVGDIAISNDEWECRRFVIDIHDFHNRTAFLNYINYETKADPEQIEEFLTTRLNENTYFKTLDPKRQKRLLDGDDMFIDGRHNAMLKLGWGENTTRGVYKYLSNHAHSLSMAFHRTEANRVYERNSGAAKVAAGFATEFARKALGTACVKMMALFPDTELALNSLVVESLKSEYTPD